MKRWEKILFLFFMLVILAAFWYSMKIATRNLEEKFGKKILITESIDSGGRVSKED